MIFKSEFAILRTPVGTVFAVASLVDPIMYVAKQSAYSAYVILIGIVGVVASALIVWYAWKSAESMSLTNESKRETLSFSHLELSSWC